MSILEEAYETDFEAAESFDEMEMAEEAARGRLRPGKRVFIPGALSSATLHTPKGPATLNLPSPVPTLTQFRALEQTVNGTTQRLNAVQTALARITREVAARRRAQQGQVTSMMMFSLLSQRRLRDDLTSHTHDTVGGPAVIPAGSGGVSSFLPFIFLMQPNAFGGGASGEQDGAMGGFSPLLLAMLFMD